VIEIGEGLTEEAVRMYRPRAFAHLGLHARAMAGVEALMADGQTRGWVLEELARASVLATAAALIDPALSAADRRRLGDQYAARAVVLLTRAAAVGFFRLPARVEALKTASHFDPLRSRPDFQKLFAGLGSETTDRP
jgi:hypothetical protein